MTDGRQLLCSICRGAVVNRAKQLLILSYMATLQPNRVSRPSLTIKSAVERAPEMQATQGLQVPQPLQRLRWPQGPRPFHLRLGSYPQNVHGAFRRCCSLVPPGAAGTLDQTRQSQSVRNVDEPDGRARSPSASRQLRTHRAVSNGVGSSVCLTMETDRPRFASLASIDIVQISSSPFRSHRHPALASAIDEQS